MAFKLFRSWRVLCVPCRLILPVELFVKNIVRNEHITIFIWALLLLLLFETYAALDLLISTVKGCICKQVQRLDITDSCESAVVIATIARGSHYVYICVSLLWVYDIKTNARRCCSIGVGGGGLKGRERGSEGGKEMKRGQGTSYF